MPDTIRTDAANIANLANNTTGAISAQDMRDIYISLAARAGFRLGTSGGTAQAQTLSTGLSLSDWGTGMRFSFMAGLANTAADPTMTLDALAARVMKHRDGSAFKAGAIAPSIVYDAEYDGTVVRVLNAGGWMAQADFDVMYPVGRSVVLWDNNDPNTQLPAGITATFTQVIHTGSPYRTLAIGASWPVATFQGAASVPLPNHLHAVNLTTGGTSADVGVDVGADFGVGLDEHTHPVVGATGNPTTSPAIDLIPYAAIVRLWVRTA